MASADEARQRAAFITDLRAELQAFTEFLQTLEAEQEALLNGKIDSLLQFARAKSEKITQLSKLANQRNQYLRSLGFPLDRSGVPAWIIAHGEQDADQVSRLWHELLDIADQAQHINQANGTMIESRLRNNQQALAALQTAANQNGFYGPDGQTHWHGVGRPLGKV